jgi:hypothetical protein
MNLSAIGRKSLTLWHQRVTVVPERYVLGGTYGTQPVFRTGKQDNSDEKRVKKGEFHYASIVSIDGHEASRSFVITRLIPRAIHKNTRSSFTQQFPTEQIFYRLRRKGRAKFALFDYGLNEEFFSRPILRNVFTETKQN